MWLYNYVFLSNLNKKPVNTNTNTNVPFDSIGAKGNHIENFLAYVDQQKFCPIFIIQHLHFGQDSLKKYGNGVLGKFCCTSCYYLVSEEIYCGDNKTGLYKLCRLNEDYIVNLREYYDAQMEI